MNPAQPPQDAAYAVAGNPADKNPLEQAESRRQNDSGAVALAEARERGDVPLPSSHAGGGVPSSLGRGSRTGAGDVRDGEPGLPNTEAEQMRPYGEGEVAYAQQEKSGFGEQEDLAGDLERKKREQAPLREEMRQLRETGVDVGGSLSETGGPAVVEGR